MTSENHSTLERDAQRRAESEEAWKLDEEITLQFFRATGGNPEDFGFFNEFWTPNNGANPLTLEAVRAKAAKMAEWAELIISSGRKPSASTSASSTESNFSTFAPGTEEETERSLAILLVLSGIKEFKRDVQATPEACGLEEPVFDEDNPLTFDRAIKITDDLREAKKNIMTDSALRTKVKSLRSVMPRVMHHIGTSLNCHTRSRRSAPRPLMSHGEKSSPGNSEEPIVPTHPRPGVAGQTLVKN